MEALRNVGNAIDDYVGKSTFGRMFRLEGSGHEKELKNTRFLREIRAGVTTFFTMSYIIAVNALILTDSGATCKCDSSIDRSIDPPCASDPAYNQCLTEINRDFVVATSAISGFASFLFGFFTNLPVALAPGMGINAYFTYQVVGFHGLGKIPYEIALAAVFIEGFIFIALSLLGMRQWLVKLLPHSIKIASAVGIGLFLTLIGLSTTAGLGAVSGASSTPMDLAGCPAAFRDAAGACASHKMQDPAMWLGITLGGMLITYLLMFNFKAAFLIGIILTSIVSWPRNTAVTYFPHDPEGSGDAKFDFFKKVVAFHPLQHTLNVIEWNLSAHAGQFALALFTFLYVDIIDCTGTLYSMARISGVVDDSTGDFPRSTLAYCTDAFSISIGALLGVSPVTAFIESSSGIMEGGRTGLTAMVTGICFIISIFFAPIFASIPPWATGGTLVIVGAMMMRQVKVINWDYIGDAVPAFVTLAFIPFSYSIAYGLIAGLLCYVVINTMVWLTMKISGNRAMPVNYEQKDYWTWLPGGVSPWFV
ncbi:xanthine/uracil permease family protein-like protein, partial [Aulographum hederae CBS 113979]